MEVQKDFCPVPNESFQNKSMLNCTDRGEDRYERKQDHGAASCGDIGNCPCQAAPRRKHFKNAEQVGRAGKAEWPIPVRRYGNTSLMEGFSLYTE